MKYLTYFLIAIASTFLVIPLSLVSCSPPPSTTTTQPSVMEHPSPTQPPATNNQAPDNQATNNQATNNHPEPQPQTSSSTATTTVKIRNFKFEPATVTIAPGETVQFINLDEEPHTATSTDGTFNSKALDTNQTWNYTATKPGTFPYICSVHPFMKGTLTVKPKQN